MSSPHASSQRQYQVRFDWGAVGAASVGVDADVVVWVDALAPGPLPALVAGPSVVTADLRNVDAVADWVLERQAEKADRFFVAVIAAGAERADGSSRFAVEDQLAAGAVIDALVARGIDYTSPEAAAACASFEGLRRALRHLFTASESGRALAGSPDALHEAASLNSSDAVVQLR